MSARRRLRHPLRFVTELTAAARSRPAAVAMIGRAEVSPGAQNIIPERVTLSVHARAAEPAAFDQLRGTVNAAAAGPRARHTGDRGALVAQRARGARAAAAARSGSRAWARGRSSSGPDAVAAGGRGEWGRGRGRRSSLVCV
jgi:hypothetical protein